MSHCTLSRFICLLVAASPLFYWPQLLFDLSRFPPSPTIYLARNLLLHPSCCQVDLWGSQTEHFLSLLKRPLMLVTVTTGKLSRVITPGPPRLLLLSLSQRSFPHSSLKVWYHPLKQVFAVSTTTGENVIWRVIAPGLRPPRPRPRPRPRPPLTLLARSLFFSKRLISSSPLTVGFNH